MDKIDFLLSRGVDEVLPSKEELEKVLRSGKKLRIYQGFDPSSEQLHIGHMIGLRKLSQWQTLGHEVIFLIGDFTGRIGDPSGREETRPLLSKEAIDKNAKTYKEQAGKILDFSGKNPVKVKFNSEWLDKLSVPEILNLFSHITYQQVIKRGMFKKRLEKDEDVSFNELTYPIMQGYDSVSMDVDVEIGGRDQLFNMMMGRDLMHKMKHKNKFVMTTQLLVDSQGNKIGKTEGNAIALTMHPDKIFSSIMNFPDELIVKCFEYLTDLTIDRVKKIQANIEKGQNPMIFKKQLALEIVQQLDGKIAAQKAQEEFEKVFQKGEKPKEPIRVSASDGLSLSVVIEKGDPALSKSQIKRLFDQDAIEVNGKTEKDQKTKTKKSDIIRVGKRTFIEVI